MKVKNKWNGLIYEVLEVKDNSVTLKRLDSSIFTIQKNLYLSTYIDLETKHKCLQK